MTIFIIVGIVLYVLSALVLRKSFYSTYSGNTVEGLNFKHPRVWTELTTVFWLPIVLAAIVIMSAIQYKTLLKLEK